MAWQAGSHESVYVRPLHGMCRCVNEYANDKWYQSGTKVANSIVLPSVNLGGQKFISLLKMHSN